MKRLLPSDDGEDGIGSSSLQWGEGHFVDLYIDGNDVNTSLLDKADKDGGNIVSPSDWRANLDVPSQSDLAAAIAPKATAGGVRFDGVSTTGGFVTTGDGFDLGANDFTCYWQGVVADKSVNRVYQNILSKTNSSNYVGFGALNSGAFAIGSSGYAGASLILPATATTLIDQYVGQTISVIWGRVSAAWFMYVNGSPVALSGGNSCAAATLDVSDIRSALNLVTPSSGEHKSHAIFNRALTAAEVATLHRDGLAAIPALGGWGAPHALAAYPMDDGIGRQLRDLHPTDPKPALLSATGFEHLLPRDEGWLTAKDVVLTNDTYLLEASDILPANVVVDTIIVGAVVYPLATTQQNLTYRRIRINYGGGSLTLERSNGTTHAALHSVYSASGTPDIKLHWTRLPSTTPTNP